jgi:predicted permease
MLPPIFSDIIFISGRVLAFNTLIAIAAGVFVGVAPSFQASRRELRNSLSDSGTRGSNAGVGRGRLRRGLVMAQLSLALVLLVSSGLLVRGLMAARAIDPGFRSEQLLTFNVRLPETGYPDDQSTRAFQRDLLARIEALPGVEAAAASTHLPMSGSLPQTYYAVEGENYTEGGEPTSPYQWVSDGFFQALEIPLGRGRLIGQEAGAGTTPVMVVNEAFVARHWPDGDALGRRVEIAGEAREIVGVVGNVRSTSPLAPPRPSIYLPLSQGPRRTLSFALRTSDTPTSVTPAVRAAVREMDPDQPIFDVLTMEEMIANALVGEIIMPRIAGGLAVLALILALVGVYGTMAHAVASRRQETGIRMALGATQGTILRMVVGQGARMLAIGSGVGLGLAALAARGLSSQLFGVPSFDLAIFGLTTLILLGVGLVAAYLPARRATGVDPVRCMRAE